MNWDINFKPNYVHFVCLPECEKLFIENIILQFIKIRIKFIPEITNKKKYPDWQLVVIDVFMAMYTY